MIIGIVLVLSIIILMFLAKQNRNIMARRICMAFLALWIGVFILSLFNPYELFPVSFEVYLLVLLFLVSFTIGITFSYNKNAGFSHEVGYASKAKYMIDWLVDSKFLIIVAIFCDLFLLYAFSQQQQALLQASIQDLRLEGSQDYLFGDNGLLGKTYNLFVIPVSSILQVLFAYILICRRDKIIPLIVCLMDVVLSTAVNNSRGVLMTVLIYVVFIVYCCPFIIPRGNKKNRFRTIIILTVFALGAFAFVSYLTAQRLFGTNEFSGEAVEMGVDRLFEHVVTYFVAPMRCFEYGINHNYFDLLGGPTLGRSFLGFFDGFMGFVFNHLGFNYTTANDVIYTYLQEKWIWVGMDMNFAYTAMFNCYMDFGVFGIAFLPALFGVAIKKCCMSFLKKGNPALFFLSAYLFLALWECYFGWILYRWAVAFYFIIIYALYLYCKKQMRIRTQNISADLTIS